MKNFLFKLLVGIIILGVIAAVVLVFWQKKVRESGLGDLQKDPETAASEFYKWYLDFKGHPIKSGAYQNISLITDRYKTYIASLDYDSLLFDPILCAKGKPYKYKVSGASTSADGNFAVVTMDQDYYGTSIKTQINLIKTGTYWLVDNISCVYTKDAEPDITRKPAVIYFLNQSKQPKVIDPKNLTCGVVHTVARTITVSSDDQTDPDKTKENEYLQIISQLFDGPNAPEKAQGYTSVLKPKDLAGFKLIGTVAYVNLSSSMKNNISNSSCDILNLTAQIEETLKFNREITRVLYAFDGNPTDFYEWSQIGCQTIDEINNCDLSNW